MIFESRRRGGSAATTMGQYRVASGIRNKADSLGDVPKKKLTYTRWWDQPGGDLRKGQNHQYSAVWQGHASIASASTILGVDGTETSS